MATVKTLVAPVLNQGSYPTCVSCAVAGVQAVNDYGDFRAWMKFDTLKFHSAAGGTLNGLPTSSALSYLAATGYPSLTVPFPASWHRVSSFTLLTKSATAIKAAINAGKPVLVGGPWYHSWWTPTSSGLLPAPDYEVGGHEFYIYGYNEDSAPYFLARNSWGPSWGPIGGDFKIPYGYIGRFWTFYTTTDIETPDPSTYSHTMKVNIPSTWTDIKPRTSWSFSVPYSTPGLVQNQQIVTTQRKLFGAGYYAWGSSTKRYDWYGFLRNGSTVWLPGAYLTLVS